MRPHIRTTSFSFHFLALVVPAVSLLASGFFVYLYFTGDRESVAPYAHAQNNTLYRTLAERDSNNNGVPDWEDHFNAPFEQSHTPAENGATTPHDTTSYDSDTITEHVGRELLGTYLNMRRTGELSGQEKQKLLAQALETAKTVPTLTTIRPRDLTLVKSSDGATFRSYQTQVGACSKELKRFQTNELLLFALALERGDLDAKQELKEMAQTYNAVATCLQATPTPSAVAVQHAELISNLMVWSYDLESLALYDTDPIRTLSRVGSIDGDSAKARVSLFALVRLVSEYVQ